MINIKTPDEIEKMRKSGIIAGKVLRTVLESAAVGKSLIELDTLADKLILENKALPSFKMEKGYHWATCMCLNDVVVHGIPMTQKLKDGDVLCVDLGVCLDGWHADTSWTVIVGHSQNDRELKQFLSCGEKALAEAIKKCEVGNHVGDISLAMQTVVEEGGYSCVKQLVGHGVGRSLHEDPEVPCFVRGEKSNTPLLGQGMVLAVEVIYNMGQSPVVYKNDDGWTIVTKDGLPSAVFEQTVAITENGPQVLTT